MSQMPRPLSTVSGAAENPVKGQKVPAEFTVTQLLDSFRRMDSVK